MGGRVGVSEEGGEERGKGGRGEREVEGEAGREGEVEGERGGGRKRGGGDGAEVYSKR